MESKKGNCRLPIFNLYRAIFSGLKYDRDKNLSVKVDIRGCLFSRPNFMEILIRVIIEKLDLASGYIRGDD